MVYVLIGFILLIIIAPIIAILPSAKQKVQIEKRRNAMANGIIVELTHIDDPDPDPKKYLSSTGKPLERSLAVVAYKIPRQRPLKWRQAPSTDWGADRVYKGLNEPKGLEPVGHRVSLPDIGVEHQDEPVSGWRWNSKPDASLANDLGEFIRANLGKLPDDVARVEEKKYVISIYWHEAEEIRQIVDFLKGCAVVVTENPEADSTDSDGSS